MTQIRTGASPGTFFTVSGTARMVPAEDLKVHIGSNQRVDIAYYHLASVIRLWGGAPIRIGPKKIEKSIF